MSRLLLSIVELGGYPDFTGVYQSLGFEVIKENTMRKVVTLLKRQQPDVIVAEFNFQSDFRDRTSSLETLVGTCQRRSAATQIVVMYDRENQPHLERFLGTHTVAATLPFPVEEADIRAALEGLTSSSDNE